MRIGRNYQYEYSEENRDLHSKVQFYVVSIITLCYLCSAQYSIAETLFHNALEGNTNVSYFF